MDGRFVSKWLRIGLAGAVTSSISACTGATGTEEAEPVESTASAVTKTVLFRDTFEGRTTPSPWGISRDRSVDCGRCPASDTDVSAYLSRGWPAPYGSVLTVHANPANEACTFTNAIAHRRVPWKGPGNYRVELDMRQWRTDGVYQTHQLDVNYTFSRKKGWDAEKRKWVWVDRFSEVGIMLDPWNPWYGWLYIKTRGSSGQIRGIADLKPRSRTWATDWHHLVVNNILAPEDGLFRLESIYCDGQWYVVREDLGTFLHEVDHEWQWSDNETLLLEGSNVWTQCSTSSRLQGIAVYDNVEVAHIPF